MNEQVGTPEEVYDQPFTPFVYSFLGDVNLFHGRLESGSDGSPAMGAIVERVRRLGSVVRAHPQPP